MENTMTLSLRDIEQGFLELREKHKILYGSLGISEKRSRLGEVTAALNDPMTWNDTELMAELNREKRLLENSIALFSALERSLDELGVSLEFAPGDTEMAAEAEKHLFMAQAIATKLEFQKMLGEETDPNNAFLAINAGAGGRESQDWVVMLMRMYLRWAERRGMRAEEIDRVTGDDATGIKSVTLLISGEYAYGYLKAEIGVHRLVRISPFDANKRRHTSFASVFVTPEIDDSIEIKIDENDLKIDTYRSGGAGGQHVNKTDSAVRITHIPTGIVVQCQNERSQHKNKATALKMLRSKLFELEMEKKAAENAERERNKMEIDFGSQIRSYVLHPYKMVKDHRTGFETSNAEAVLDGEEILDRFMEEFLLKRSLPR